MKQHETEVRVIYADTDKMGIVYYVNYFKWFEIGRTEMLRAMGFPYSRLEAEGLWLPVVSADCQYKAPAKYDDVLVIRTTIKEMSGASVVLAYEIFNKETGTLLVTGSTKHPTTDVNLKPTRLKHLNPALYAAMKEFMD